MLKRIFDILLSLAALVVVWPFLLLAAVLVRLDSPGPALFVQERVGRNFRRFRLFKFRTMAANAGGPGITYGADRRITRVGKVLRKTKVDELPQLLNVLRGDMSFVGPRPELPQYTEMFAGDYAEVLAVRPGITSPASLKYRSEAEILGRVTEPTDYYVRVILPDKLKLDKQYLTRLSFWYDLSLILATARACVRPEPQRTQL